MSLKLGQRLELLSLAAMEVLVVFQSLHLEAHLLLSPGLGQRLELLSLLPKCRMAPWQMHSKNYQPLLLGQAPPLYAAAKIATARVAPPESK